MRGAVLYGPRDVRFEERENPAIVQPTDAIIRMSATCVCGSDLWPYRGIQPVPEPVLFGEVWKRPGLSPRDRSLITVAALVAGYRTNELPFHVQRALENGVTQGEIIELVTHLAFYSGWPTANSALPIARRVFAERKP